MARGVTGVRLVERKYKRTPQEGSVAMPLAPSMGLAEVGSMLPHKQTDSDTSDSGRESADNVLRQEVGNVLVSVLLNLLGFFFLKKIYLY